MKLGFTGTQRGMTPVQHKMVQHKMVQHKMVQHKMVQSLRLDWSPTEVHHGDCIGSDEEMHALCRLHASQARIMVHPPLESKKRAFCAGDTVLPPRSYLERNYDIVDAVEAMSATSESMCEVRRSGTWSTIRYARKKLCSLHIVFTDGTISQL
jgi:hypothetical protein